MSDYCRYTQRHFLLLLSTLCPFSFKMPMHVRLKRKNQTIFLHVDPADNFSQLKNRVAEIHGMEANSIMILGPDKVSTVSLDSEYF